MTWTRRETGVFVFISLLVYFCSERTRIYLFCCVGVLFITLIVIILASVWFLDNPYRMYEKYEGHILSFLPEWGKTKDLINGREMISIYVMDNSDITLSNMYSNTLKFELYIECGDSERRKVTYYDEDCYICKRIIRNGERRVFQKRGSECYICYRKRVDSRDVQILLY